MSELCVLAISVMKLINLITLKKVCLTDRNIGFLYLYLYTYLVSCLLCGVGSSSLRKTIKMATKDLAKINKLVKLGGQKYFTV